MVQSFVARAVGQKHTIVDKFSKIPPKHRYPHDKKKHVFYTIKENIELALGLLLVGLVMNPLTIIVIIILILV